MKLAVIGAGVSGLVSAHLLSGSHEVTLFEAEPRLGGHVNTVRLSHRTLPLNIDTGFIVYNETNYPLFSRLLEKLGVPTQPTSMSFSVRDDTSNIEYSGHSFNTLFSQRPLLFNKEHWRMLWDIRQFMHYAPKQISATPNLEIEAFLRQFGYSRPFAERFLIPLAASLWSSPEKEIRQFPARFVTEFLAHHGMLSLHNRPQWRVVTGGSVRYVERLLEVTPICIRKGNPVKGLGRTRNGVVVHTEHETECFEEVIVACHSNQALSLLQHPTKEEQEILGGIRYQENDVVLHTDTSVLPRNPNVWASWNYRVLAGSSYGAAVTYNMNLLQSIDAEETYCVSLNQSHLIAPEKIVRRFQYHHPIATLEAEAAKLRRHELLRHQRISYCGAYWGYGFHEDGTRSAYDVFEAFAKE